MSPRFIKCLDAVWINVDMIERIFIERSLSASAEDRPAKYDVFVRVSNQDLLLKPCPSYKDAVAYVKDLVESLSKTST